MMRPGDARRLSDRMLLVGMLVESARRSRLHRAEQAAVDARGACDQADRRRRHRAASGVERLLGTKADQRVDCARYFGRLAGLKHMAWDEPVTMSVSVAAMSMDAGCARRIGVAVIELLDFAKACIAGADARVYFVLGREGRRLVFGIAVEGDIRIVPEKGAMELLLRGRAIVRGLGGGFERGMKGHRMIMGLTFRMATVGASR